MAVSVGEWATVALGAALVGAWKGARSSDRHPRARLRLPAVRLAKVRAPVAPPFLSRPWQLAPPSQCDSRVSQVGRGRGRAQHAHTPGQRPPSLTEGTRDPDPVLPTGVAAFQSQPLQIRPELCSAQVQNLIFPVSSLPSTANCQLPTQKQTKQQPVGTLRAAAAAAATATYVRVPVPSCVLVYALPAFSLPPSAAAQIPDSSSPACFPQSSPPTVRPTSFEQHSTRSPGSQGPSSLLPTVATLLKIILGGAGVDFPSHQTDPQTMALLL